MGPGKLLKEIEEKVRPLFLEVEERVLHNQDRVLEGFRKSRVSESCFAGSTGYGYGDSGRQALEEVFSHAFGTEDSLVRMQFVSGTHALATCFFALLRPGDVLLSAAGAPYDTLQGVIGLRGKDKGNTLVGQGIHYREVSLDSRGRLDFSRLAGGLEKKPAVVFLQRSRGYAWRPAVSLEEIGRAAGLVKKISPGSIFFVDNCYGEFVETREPPGLGADLVAGSLIKNPGGGLAPLGGYACGRRDLILEIAERLAAPGLGKEMGAAYQVNRAYFQGFFLAPHFVGEALKVAILGAALLEGLGFEVSPRYDEARSDIVQAIKFGDPDLLLAFCRGIQATGPIDSFASPEPGSLAGYGEKIIMAAPTFYQGASLELSADAPFKPPYIAYLQGGLTYAHGKLGILRGAREVLELTGPNK